MKIESLKVREKEYLLKALNKTFWDVEKAAGLLKILPSQPNRKIKEHGLQRPRLP
jgi:DNA-binding NtrC family response regulator